MPAIELGGISLGMREAVILLIAAVAVYMLIVAWRMRRLSQPKTQARPPVAEVPPPAVPAPETWEEAPAGLAEDVLRRGLEGELAQLRDEVEVIRGELAALRVDLQHELAQLRATQTVSPLYGDAMQLAAAGYDPAAIAERCGIARAEAELVVALAKSQNQER